MMPAPRRFVLVDRGELLRLAGLARRLSPDRNDPEQFCIRKDEIERGLRRLAHARDLR
jgi:hypothetical protein